MKAINAYGSIGHDAAFRHLDKYGEVAIWRPKKGKYSAARFSKKHNQAVEIECKSHAMPGFPESLKTCKELFN